MNNTPFYPQVKHRLPDQNPELKSDDPKALKKCSGPSTCKVVI